MAYQTDVAASISDVGGDFLSPVVFPTKKECMYFLPTAAEIASSRWANKFRFFARFAIAIARMLQFLLPQLHLEWWYTVKTPRTRSFPTREFSNHEHKRKKGTLRFFLPAWESVTVGDVTARPWNVGRLDAFPWHLSLTLTHAMMEA